MQGDTANDTGSIIAPHCTGQIGRHGKVAGEADRPGQEPRGKGGADGGDEEGLSAIRSAGGDFAGRACFCEYSEIIDLPHDAVSRGILVCAASY